MTDRPNKQKKKCTITEEDIAAIIEKYPPMTLLTLLQEIAQNPREKLDWNSLVEKTATGITNPREYQMLWRHLAYQAPLSDDVEDGAQPLDDDSDLECELEAFPRASAEATSEAAACVKLLVASGPTSESNLLNSSTIEAPLIINVPNRRQPSEGPSDNSQGTYITVPVLVQKQPHSSTLVEPLDPSGLASGSMTARRKRKQWTLEEDEELKSAVKKCGEGNWTNILKEEYMAGRTASQLSQRWSILKKKDARLDVSSSGDPRLSDVQQAARHAMSVALDGMKGREETNINSTVDTPSNTTAMNTTALNAAARTAMAKASFISSSNAKDQNLTQKGPVLKKSPSTGQLSSTEKPNVTAKLSSEKSDFVPNSTVRATAVAAGARIATASDAAFLLKAAQSKNAVHIKSSTSAKPVVPAGPLRPGSFAATKQSPSTVVGSSAKNAAVTSNPSNKLLPKNVFLAMEVKKVSKVEAESKSPADIKVKPVPFPALSKVSMDKTTISGNKAEIDPNTDDNKKSACAVLQVEIQPTVGENSENQSTKEEVSISGQNNEGTK